MLVPRGLLKLGCGKHKRSTKENRILVKSEVSLIEWFETFESTVIDIHCVMYCEHCHTLVPAVGKFGRISYLWFWKNCLLASWFANVDISEDRQIADDELLSFLSKSIDGNFRKPCLKDSKYFSSTLYFDWKKLKKKVISKTPWINILDNPDLTDEEREEMKIKIEVNIPKTKVECVFPMVIWPEFHMVETAIIGKVHPLYAWGVTHWLNLEI